MYVTYKSIGLKVQSVHQVSVEATCVNEGGRDARTLEAGERELRQVAPPAGGQCRPPHPRHPHDRLRFHHARHLAPSPPHLRIFTLPPHSSSPYCLGSPHRIVHITHQRISLKINIPFSSTGDVKVFQIGSSWATAILAIRYISRIPHCFYLKNPQLSGTVDAIFVQTE